MSMPLSQMWYVYRYSHTAPKICKSPFSPNVQDTDTESELFVSVKDPFDYQGRSFLHPPQDVGVNLRSEEPPEKCFLPKKQIFTWTGHTKGVSAIRWFPRYAHLLLSCSMDTKIKVSGFFFFFPFLLLNKKNTPPLVCIFGQFALVIIMCIFVVCSKAKFLTFCFVLF